MGGNRLTTYVRAAVDPKGVRYLVTIAPPGSLIDTNLVSGAPGWVGEIFTLGGLLRSGRRAAKRGWRLAVERSWGGQWRESYGVVYRERVPDRSTAEKRATEVAAGIVAGTWYPGLARSTS